EVHPVHARPRREHRGPGPEWADADSERRRPGPATEGPAGVPAVPPRRWRTVTVETDVSESAAGASGRKPAVPLRRRRGRRWAVGTVVVLLVAGGGVAYRVVEHRHRATPASGNAAPRATAPIIRGDVIDTESVDGKLSYPNGRSITAGGSGAVTATPVEGSTVDQGQALCKVANCAIVLM